MMPQTARVPAPDGRYARFAVRCACIDIGSNTTRLLVADVVGRPRGGMTLAPVVERRAFTQLGRACHAGGAVPTTALAALAAVVAAQATEARTLGVEALRVVATAALRRSADGLATCHALAAAAGAPVELLSEHDEARLAFAGATSALADASDRALAVVDVGGGSAQIVVGTCEAGAGWSVSLPLGSGDLTAAYLHGDPPAGGELTALRDAVSATLSAIALPPVERTLAVGGSATSLRRLAGARLDHASLEPALTTLVAAPAAKVAERLRVAPERARLLPAGIVVLAGLAERLGTLEVARGGLREGVLHELAAAA
jgi:exopolyphosphatase / guanosine-5'-triphosphate,3'-diphosphate pyrophosphatase